MGFVTFWQKNIGKKRTRKMLVKMALDFSCFLTFRDNLAKVDTHQKYHHKSLLKMD